jgi:hypothetical protein
MPYFRKKPVLIEARQFPADAFGVSMETLEKLDESERLTGIYSSRRDELALVMERRALAAWCGGTSTVDALGPCILIDTLEGQMKANPGDWIIRGVKGEFYPCKPDIFEATYEVSP